jgi:hypothetical protein
MSEPPLPLNDPEIPVFSGLPPVLLPAESGDGVQDVERARRTGSDRALKGVVARWPGLILGWVALGNLAYLDERDVEAFAYFRTAYHRGLDRLRGNGWRGMGYVPWSHEPNRAILSAFRGLMLASAALGDLDEAIRCQKLLLDSDPADPLGVRQLGPQDLEPALARQRLREALG